MGLGIFRQLRPRGRLPLRRSAAGMLLAALAVVLIPGRASAQSAADTAPASSVILDSGAMSTTQGMDFGDIAQPATAGTVVLTPTPTPLCGINGGVVMRTGPCQAAGFAVMGRKNWLVRIREQNGGAVTLTGPGGATMIMNAITINVTDMVIAPGGGNPPGTLGRYRITSDDGFANFRIGGTLNVNASQAFGDYTGTLMIQVLFN